MKYLIASDIHGSKRATQMVLDHFKAGGADMLILLGDLLYHGPRNDLPQEYDPRAVAALLNGMKDRIIAVRGNCEAEVDQMMLEFPCMGDYTIIYIEGVPFFLTHGHLYNDDNLPPMVTPSTVLLHGHTHVPTNLRHDTHRTMNPGSTTIPKRASAPSYMVIDGNNIYWKKLTDASVYMVDRVK